MTAATVRRRTRALLLLTLLGLVTAARPWAVGEAALLAETDSASVAWPVSTGLLVGEIVTGGASASDEFVELYNAAAVAQPLAGLELVYASASGATVTRKAAWSDGSVPAHGHLLLANSAGIWARHCGRALQRRAVSQRWIGRAARRRRRDA